MVSHDREFINNVATSVLAFETGETLQLYAGGYDDYISQRKDKGAVPEVELQKATDTSVNKTEKKRLKVKLSYKEERELERLPEDIEELEAQQSSLHETLNAPETYQDSSVDVAGLQANLREIESRLEAAMTRWEELETLKESLEA